MLLDERYKIFNFSVNIAFGCDDVSSFSSAAKMIENHKPDVFLGPECGTGLSYNMI